MAQRIHNSFFLTLALILWTSGCASQGRSGEAPNSANAQVAEAQAKEFDIEGYYAEACSCKPPCPCELTGPIMACKGVGAYQFNTGHYGGLDFSGTRVAYSLYIGEAVVLYIDAPDAHKRAAAERFARAALKGFGPIKAAHTAKVELAGRDGAYTIRVDGGKIMSCTTEPVLGGDHKTAVTHTNTFDALNPVMYQAICTACTYADGDMKVELEKGRNAYFNAHMKSSGKL